MKQILKVIVGSRAHGLSKPESDYDYRGVYIQPTNELLKINPKIVDTNWHENKNEEIDNTSWEIGKFMFLATKCNPTILEVFCAPMIEPFTDEGVALREQFQRVWNSKGVRDSFVGYGLNQRKKFLDKKDNRPNKYATAYLRTLIQAYELLTFRVLRVDFTDHAEFETLWRFKNGQYDVGEVIQRCYEWENKVRETYEHNQDKQTDFDQLNAFLLKIRRSNWE